MLCNTNRELARTRRGRVICKSNEVYSRFDIGCGSLHCKKCVSLQPLKATLSKHVYLIPDASVVVHQMDILTSPVFLSKFNVILLQSVLSELRKTEWKTYKRLQNELTECHKYNASVFVFMDEFSENTHTNTKHQSGTGVDAQLRRMVGAYRFYETHLQLNRADVGDSDQLYIICESAKKVKMFECLRAHALKIDVLVQTLFPLHLCNLQDSLSFVVEDDGDDSNKNKKGQPKSGSVQYQAHWSASRVQNELKRNTERVFSGKFVSIRGHGRNAFGKVLRADGEVVINGLNHINRAIHDDQVAVQMINEKEGKIVSVTKRNWRAYCGSLQESDHAAAAVHSKNRGFIYFVPIDARIPKIGIVTSQIAHLMDKRIIVVIDDWKTSSAYPTGHYCETIGVIGDLETETQVLLLEHDIPHKPWSDAVLQCLPDNVYGDDVDVETVRDLHQRRNLLNAPEYQIFSVDPDGCVDIDDALHCRHLVNGNVEIGVHIADVSYYIQSNNALDVEAAKRGTSVYLVDRRIDMLPALLSTNLCSLKPKKIRLSFSVFWELAIDDKRRKYRVVNTSFARCVIRSAKAFSYREAQNMIDDARDRGELAKALRTLLFVSKLLKEERIDNGALSLSSLQPKFKFSNKKGSEKQPTSLSAYKMYATNSMIEEFMLFANVCVATKILSAFPSNAMLRRHPKPSNSMLTPLIKSAAIRGFKINIENSKELSQSINECHDAKDASFNQLIRIMTTRCMTQAIYFVSGSLSNKSDYLHYGLASGIYTHFTSPIRRYADIIVHRQLAYCCGFVHKFNQHDIQYLKNKTLINDIVNSINRRHRLAQYINRASSNLYTLIFFDNIGATQKTPIVVEDAIISGVDQNCLNIFIAKYCMERRIYLDNKDEWKFDETKLTLSKMTPPSFKYKIFDKVCAKIYVHTSRNHRKKLVVQLADFDRGAKSKPPMTQSSAVVHVDVD